MFVAKYAHLSDMSDDMCFLVFVCMYILIPTLAITANHFTELNYDVIGLVANT